MTQEEIQALEAVVEYLHEEKADYEANPATGHIYESIQILEEILFKEHAA